MEFAWDGSMGSYQEECVMLALTDYLDRLDEVSEVQRGIIRGLCVEYEGGVPSERGLDIACVRILMDAEAHGATMDEALAQGT